MKFSLLSFIVYCLYDIVIYFLLFWLLFPLYIKRNNIPSSNVTLSLSVVSHHNPPSPPHLLYDL